MRIEASEIFDSLVASENICLQFIFTYRSFDRKMTHLQLNNFSRKLFFSILKLEQRFNFWLKFLDSYTI